MKMCPSVTDAAELQLVVREQLHGSWQLISLKEGRKIGVMALDVYKDGLVPTRFINIHNLFNVHLLAEIVY